MMYYYYYYYYYRYEECAHDHFPGADPPGTGVPASGELGVLWGAMGALNPKA